jgi:signal transduction histidine kinase
MPRMRQMFGNLSIGSKLVGLLAVPVVAAVLLGVAGVAGAWGDRARAGQERRLAAVAGQALAAVHELQEERARAVAWAAGERRDGQADPRARRRRVDRALAAYRAGAARLGPTGDPALDRAVATAAERLDRLAVTRALVDRRLLPPERAAVDHDTMVAALLGVARGLADRLDAPGPARVARLLLAVTGAKEATGQERTLLATPEAAASDRPANPAGAAPAAASDRPARPAGAARASDDVLRVRLAAAAAVARHELSGVRAAAGDRLEEIDRALGVPGARTVRGLELALLQPAEGPPAVTDLRPWRAGLAVRAGALRQVEREVAGDLDEATRAWLGRQERRLRDRLVLVAVVALAALAVVPLLHRGTGGRGARPPAWATLPGLARRARALADRQLQLLEELARDEPDPQRRQALVGVDHLAARLRRAAETLLAMTGPDPARDQARPAPLSILLRRAVAEAGPGGAQERRVELLTTGEVEVAGPAGADLVHLLAELLDNAAAFSPPTAPVLVTGAAEGDGYLIEVADRGLGMTGPELAWANQRLAGDPTPDPAGQAADRLGLLVVARLAGANGFGVRLGPSPEGGVTAAVRLPAAVLSTRAPAPVPPG